MNQLSCPFSVIVHQVTKFPLENILQFSGLLSFRLCIYLSDFERIFSILQFTRLLDSISLCWFNALGNSKLARYIYYRCLFDLFSILQPHSLSKFARTVLYPYAIPVRHLLI